MAPRRLFSWLAASALLATASHAAELSGNPTELREFLRSQTNKVTLTHSATETGYADVAKVTLMIVVKDKELSDAMSRNQSLRESIQRELTGAGIDPDDIRVSRYSASPRSGWLSKTVSSYEMTSRLTVTVSDEAAFQAVARVADERDEVEFAGAEFEHSEKEAFGDRARESAMAKIMRDKAYFEEQLGFRLQPVAFAYSPVSERMADGAGFAKVTLTVTV